MRAEAGPEQVLHSFGSGTDGAQSQGGLIFDAEGNLYGMTTYGGANGLGIVFETVAHGGWKLDGNRAA